MKCLVITLSLLLAMPAWSATEDILKCLGKEEKRFHVAKTAGPVYDLNQKLIAEMIQIPNAQIAPVYLKEICTAESFSESWKMLELSIKKGKEIFIIPDTITGMQREVTSGMIEDFVDSTRETFLNFIASIQTISPTPDCLKEEIPELNNFFLEIKHLQEDVDLKNIFLGKDQKIFNRLKDYPRAFQACRARLKKKPKSGSVPEAKKP